jgi:hypothetical protein
MWLFSQPIVPYRGAHGTAYYPLMYGHVENTSVVDGFDWSWLSGRLSGFVEKSLALRDSLKVSDSDGRHGNNIR